MGVLKGLSRTLYTLENEWRDNQQGISCIPAGTYMCVGHGWAADSTVKKPKTWELVGIPGRSAILIHAGNYTKDTQGCILAGMGMQVTQLMSMVADSNAAINLMRKEIGNASFTITIADEVKAS
jgi:hypothetical protein